MEIKKSRIYRFLLKEKKSFRFDYPTSNDFVGIVTEIEQDFRGKVFYRVCALTGNFYNVYEEDIVSTNRTRLKPEIREILISVYQTNEQLKSKRKEIEVLQKEASNLSSIVSSKTEKLSELSNIYSIHNLTSKLTNSISSSDGKSEGKINFAFKTFNKKYASENEFTFLHREYDGQLTIHDYEKGANDLAEKIPEHQLNEMTNELKYIQLESVSNGIGLGDKNTLYAYQKLEFRIDKKHPLKEVLTDLKRVDNWVSEHSIYY